ncbi:hypothetical protein BHM03_00050722, partial [Ensete ventricosum]
ILFSKEVKGHHLQLLFISDHPESWNPIWSVSRYGTARENFMLGYKSQKLNEYDFAETLQTQLCLPKMT